MAVTKYQIEEQLNAAPQFLMYRATPVEGNGTVILKMFSSPYPSQHALNRLQSEFSILQGLPGECIARATAIENMESRLVLVLEDNKETTLEAWLKNGVPGINEFFTIALQLAKALNVLHQHKILHKNISPASVLLNTQTMQVKLTGFNLASRLAREGLYADTKEIMEYRLAYISPEQTGRINSTIDFRSDYYSFGAVLYELLTGKPPFVAEDPLQMVHSHIARKPKAPGLLRPEAPESLSAIILKLLSKSKEERYQTIAGLLYDLKQCLQLYNAGHAAESFVLGEKDISDQFRISEKIYGREEQLEKLRQALMNAGDASAAMLLISGYSGVGKSRLVKQIQKTYSEQAGFFITGKFDEFKKNEPLSSLLAALKELLRELLSQSQAAITEWRTKVLEAVGNNGRLIIEVLPDAALLIGPQPPVPVLPPAEAKNRFNETFNSFIKLFCQPHSPLCIFLDDLQWMDSATRQWMETQLLEKNIKNLLLIGAYRNNEVTPSHPLMLMLHRLQQAGVQVDNIVLEALNEDQLNQLVADTLAANTESTAPLAEAIFQKTNGNPFFTRQCLLSLYENNAIYFDEESQAWQYDLRLVQQAKISDNVIELMVTLIERLNPPAQHLLKTAACIGYHFNLNTLHLVTGKTIEEINKALNYAFEEGIIIPFNAWQYEGPEEFVFLHDRVQQALISLLPEADRRAIHLQIGRVMLGAVKDLENDEKIYDVANHFNYASTLITNAPEKHTLAEINLHAGIRAKKASAYEQAKAYLAAAMDALTPEELNKTSVLTSHLFLQRAEAEHLCGNNEIAEEFYNKAIALCEDEMERSKAFQRKIHYYINLGKFGEAYQTGRRAVRQLGINLPPKFIPPLLIKDIILYRVLRGRRTIPGIVDLPEMQDERLKMAVLLMSTFARAAYQIRPELCVALCFKIVNTCLKHGNTEGVNVGYLAVGPIFFGAILNQKQSGYDFAQLTLALVEKYKSHAFKAETYFVAGYFAVPWRKPAAEMEQYWQIAYETGLEVGDLFHASCACCATIQSYYMRGMAFNEVKRHANRYLEFLDRIHNSEAILTIKAVLQTIANLCGETTSPLSYNTANFNEADYIIELQGFGSRHFAHYYYINKMQTLYLWGEYRAAYETSIQSDKYLKDSPGMLHTAEHYFYKGLIICALYNTAPSAEKGKLKSSLKAINHKLSGYAKGCADNFEHKAQLLRAETARLNGEVQAAESAYYAAIEAATKYGYTNMVALAHQLAMQFQYSLARNAIAAFHLRNAIYAYKAWGATAYVQHLHNKYLPLFDAAEIANQEGRYAYQELNAGTENALDLATVLKSSEAISREIRLPDLVAALMKLIIENAGAQRMVLLLQQEAGLVVYAECSADSGHIHFTGNIALNNYQKLPATIIYYVSRAGKPLILENAAESEYKNDAYVSSNNPKSVLCAPLIKQGKLTGVIYVENNLSEAVFTPERINLLMLLSSQAAISIENALLYNNLEEKVKERTEELNSKNILLEDTLTTLKQSQRRLIHAEKMASLGQMATGIAHEIQNPLNFVINFANISEGLVADLKEILQAHELDKDKEEVDEILNDLQGNNAIITTHGSRAEKIVKGVLVSGAYAETKKQADINQLLDDAAERARNSFIAKQPGFEPVFIKQYSTGLPQVSCQPESLGNVFTNLIDNALYAVHQKSKTEQQLYKPAITITTDCIDGYLQITMHDNGEGISAANLDKIFVPFFTTKPTGQGNTGNGLTICHQVITENHKGEIEVNSEWGSYTEFIIKLPVN